LCDFGWAGIFDQKNMKTTFCGTLDYVSPEMKDKGAYNSTVDLWSIGVLAF
jgi:serine/threonine protein kinase